MRATLLPVILLFAACSGGDDDDAPPVDGVTYYQHLKPVIDAKCTGCHSDAGIAPFALTGWDEVHEMGGNVLLEVEAGRMPPWPPNPDCNDYIGDRSLTDEQLALFRAWDEGGRQMGDPAAEGPPLDLEQVRLSRVDTTLSMPVAYTPQTTTDNPDDYRCFLIPWQETEERFITGFRAVPGNPKVVHHVIAFYAAPGEVAEYQRLDADADGPGYPCFGGSGGPSRVWLGAWAPGSLGSDTPVGTGLRIEPGSMVVLQVHYNVLEAGPQPDLTSVELKVDASVETVAAIQPWANPQWIDSQLMHIPPNQADVVHAFEFDASRVLGGPFDIHSAALHMHTLGVSAKASIQRAGGGEECLLQIDDWNFHWQGSYGLRQPPRFAAGDRLRVECHFDNTAANQPLVGGQPRTPTDVYWGEGTTDEMCLGAFYVTPAAAP